MLQGQVRHRHRLDQRHRPGHRTRLGASGVHLMLNGFGDAAQIESLRAGLAREFGVKGDLQRRRHDEARPDPSDGEGRAGGLARSTSRQQRRHPAHGADRSFPAERWDAVWRSTSSVFHAVRQCCRDEGSQPGPHRQHRLDPRPGRLGRKIGLRGGQSTGRHRADEGDRHEPPTTGVTCNAICPGWVLTPLVQQQIDARAKRDGLSNDQAKAALLGEKQPSGEFATTEQIGAVCVFLCSDAAAQIRGVALPVDGAWVAQ